MATTLALAPAPALPALAPAAGDQIAWLGIRRKWWVLALAVPSVALAEATFTTLMFSSLQILQGIDADTFRYQLATGPYIVCLVVGALLSVRFAQTYGSQRSYLVSALVTGVGCVIAAAAESLPMMVVGRLLLSAKVVLLAVTLSQMWLAFPRRKGLSTAAYCAAMYGGLFVGAALGGFLEFRTSWRVPYAAAGCGFLLLAVAGHRLLVHDLPANPPRLNLNALEVSLLATALAAATFLIFRGPYYGWLDSNLVVSVMAVGALATAGFVWASVSQRDPLVNLHLREFPTLVFTLAVISIFSGAVVGMLNTLPPYLDLRAYPSAVAGRILLVPGMVMALTCLATGFLYGRGVAIAGLWLGLALSLIGGLWFLQADLYTSKQTVVAMLSLWSLGVGLVLPLALRLTFAGQTPDAVQRLAGVKVALRFAATVLGAFAASVFIQRGTDSAQDHLRWGVTANNPAYRQTIERIQQHVAARGSAPALAAEQAASVVGGWLARDAQMLGMQAGRRYLILLTGLALLIALFIRFRSEVSILADDLRDLEWGYVRKAQPRRSLPLGAPT